MDYELCVKSLIPSRLKLFKIHQCGMGEILHSSFCEIWLPTKYVRGLGRLWLWNFCEDTHFLGRKLCLCYRITSKRKKVQGKVWALHSTVEFRCFWLDTGYSASYFDLSTTEYLAKKQCSLKKNMYVTFEKALF